MICCNKCGMVDCKCHFHFNIKPIEKEKPEPIKEVAECGKQFDND